MNSFKESLLIVLLGITGTNKGSHISQQEAFDSGVKAYIYAYPLVLMKVTREAQDTHNNFVHISVFPTDTFKDIVRPNVDTLYSFAWLDLSQGPLILSVPNTHGRYYLIELMDAWTNVFGSIGKRTTGTKAQDFAIVAHGWKGTLPKGIKKVEAPTSMVLMLARTQTNGKDDYSFVRKIQAGYKLTPLGSEYTPEKKVSYGTAIGNKEAPVDQVAQMDAKNFYTVFAQMLKDNSPQPQDAPLLTELKKIGIEPGKDFASSEISDEIMNALDKAIPAAKRKISKKRDIIKTINGWSMMFDIGTYGTDYLLRAMIAQMGIGANLPEDALYPTAFVDSEGHQLTGKYKYIMHFNKDQIPPVNAFWSVTMYNAQSFLVKNSLDRYALGDRDHIRFNKDGSLDMYIQHESPGKDKESNWLPAPVDSFNVTMRLYWPKESVLDGTWHPPAIRRVDNF